jgi:hypothetical protein
MRFFVLFLLAVILFVGVAAADNVSAVSTNAAAPVLTGATFSGWPAYTNTTDSPIENGQCVAINSTIDISPLGWGVPSISWYGEYERGFAPDNTSTKYYNLPLPNTVDKLQKFFVAPAIFWERKGYWYQDYGMQETANDFMDNANNRMFYVNDTCPPPQLENRTFYPAFNTTNNTIPEALPFLPIRKVSDVVIARGDYVNLNVSTPTHWWMFGYDPYSKLYDQASVNAGQITLDTTNWTGIPVGDYSIDFIRPDAIGLYEEYYNPEYQPYKFHNETHPAIESPFRFVNDSDVYGQQPQGVEEALMSMKTVASNITRIHMIYQEPSISIERIDAVVNPENRSFFDVRGYTNVQANTTLTIKIDATDYANATLPNRMFTTKTVGLANDAGVLREFDAVFEVNYNQYYPGIHFLTMTSPEGATMTVPFYIYQELPAHYIPPQFVRYIGASPFITPVTVTITILVPGPTQIVTIHDTPSNEQVKEQQKNALVELVSGWVLDLILAIAGLWVLMFMYKSWRRIRWYKP